MNARPHNNQLRTYFKCVHYLLRIQQYPVNTTYNTSSSCLWHCLWPCHKEDIEEEEEEEEEGALGVLFSYA